MNLSNFCSVAGQLQIGNFCGMAKNVFFTEKHSYPEVLLLSRKIVRLEVKWNSVRKTHLSRDPLHYLKTCLQMRASKF